MSSNKKSSILIVDDEQITIQALSEILSPEYTIYVSKDGREAIDKARRLLPEIILLDIIMPEIDGYDVIGVLKKTKETKDIPVIFVTSLDGTHDEEKALSMGAADYITKPLHSPIVRMRVRNQIRIIERYALESDLNVVLKLQSELVAAKERAEHSDRAKSEFLSRMSHEMLTPMNTVIGMLKVIKMRPEKTNEYLTEIGNASKHLLELINNVLDISGMEYGVIKLEASEFSFKKMVDSIIDDSMRYSDMKKQKITYNVDMSLPEQLIGDEKRLSQVIYNILSNAIKYTPDNGEIRIDILVLNDDKSECVVQVEVADNGIGISKDQQTELFDIFQQADGGNTRKHGGIGIGLALSKKIVKMMGGNIWVESDLDKGAKFIFTCKLQKVENE